MTKIELGFECTTEDGKCVCTDCICIDPDVDGEDSDIWVCPFLKATRMPQPSDPSNVKSSKSCLDSSLAVTCSKCGKQIKLGDIRKDITVCNDGSQHTYI